MWQDQDCKLYSIVNKAWKFQTHFSFSPFSTVPFPSVILTHRSLKYPSVFRTNTREAHPNTTPAKHRHSSSPITRVSLYRTLVPDSPVHASIVLRCKTAVVFKKYFTACYELHSAIFISQSQVLEFYRMLQCESTERAERSGRGST